MVAKVSLEEGISKTISWWKKSIDTKNPSVEAGINDAMNP